MVFPENLPALSVCQVKSRGKSINFTAKEVKDPSYEYGLVAITKPINISEKKAPYVNSLILRDNSWITFQHIKMQDLYFPLEVFQNPITEPQLHGEEGVCFHFFNQTSF